LTLRHQTEQDERGIWHIQPHQLSGTMISLFTPFERARIVQKAKQLQTSLIGVLAPIQDGTQQTVHTLSQHIATPRAAQHLIQDVPGFPELLFSQQSDCFFQSRFPLVCRVCCSTRGNGYCRCLSTPAVSQCCYQRQPLR
jgi:hypothetical protein